MCPEPVEGHARTLRQAQRAYRNLSLSPMCPEPVERHRLARFDKLSVHTATSAVRERNTNQKWVKLRSSMS
jgi:hypothetical protein